MSLRAGTRLGHYDVTSLLGEGGIGQVWQATDTHLNRQVALKILPDAFADDPDRLARFTREAQILASLNHPNIAATVGPCTVSAKIGEKTAKLGSGTTSSGIGGQIRVSRGARGRAAGASDNG